MIPQQNIKQKNINLSHCFVTYRQNEANPLTDGMCDGITKYIKGKHWPFLFFCVCSKTGNDGSNRYTCSSRMSSVLYISLLNAKTRPYFRNGWTVIMFCISESLIGMFFLEHRYDLGLNWAADIKFTSMATALCLID